MIGPNRTKIIRNCSNQVQCNILGNLNEKRAGDGGDWNSSKKMTPVKNETNGGVVEEEKWEGEHISYLVQAGAGATNKSQFLSRRASVELHRGGRLALFGAYWGIASPQVRSAHR